MLGGRKLNHEKVISKILSLILDERVFTPNLVLLDSKLNIPARKSITARKLNSAKYYLWIKSFN